MLSCPIVRKGSPELLKDPIRKTLCEGCRQLTALGWINGVGGGLSIRDGNVVYLAPVGLASSSSCPGNIFVMDAHDTWLEVQEKGFAFSENKTLMLLPHRILGAKAVIHSHSLNAVLVTNLYEKNFTFDASKREKGSRTIVPDELREVPIIENSADESELARSFRRAMDDFRGSDAILIRNHGAYVWGKDWHETVSKLTSLESLFHLTLKHRRQKNLSKSRRSP